MAKKMKPSLVFFYINVVIFIILLSYLIYLNIPIVEGVIDSNCCGGVQAGVHYRETDTEPPEYISRCFKSVLNGGDGSIDYEWNGFPCTSSTSSECCSDGGECVASTKGGYCDNDGSRYVYERGSQNMKMYLKQFNDTIIDVNNENDMEDYYYDRDKDKSMVGLSKEMREFLARRDDNERYMLEKQRENKSLISQDRKSALDKIKDQNKRHQLVLTITVIHLVILVSIAIAIKEPIIEKIQEFLDLLSIQYMKFSGKSINTEN